MAERVRFEATVEVAPYNGFRDRRLRPLSHLSTYGAEAVPPRGTIAGTLWSRRWRNAGTPGPRNALHKPLGLWHSSRGDVAPREYALMDQPHSHGPGIRRQEAQDPPGALPPAHGRPDAVGAVGGAYPAVLSLGETGAPSLPPVDDAAGSLRAVVLQPERPGHGGPALRGRVGAAVRGTAADRHRCRTRRRSCTSAISWSSTSWGRVCSRRSTVTWSRRRCGSGRGRSWTPASSRRRPRRRTGRGSATRRCIRRKRGIRGTSG